MNFVVGKIINVHGIKGELKVYPMCDDVKRFELLDKVYINDKEYEVSSVRYHKGNVLMKLVGIDSINDAEKLKTYEVSILEEDAMPLEEDEYYIRDLYDMEVYDESGDKIGFISEILFTASNDVFEVTKDDGKKVLIPNIKDCVKTIDVNNKKMTIKVMEGLM